MFDNVIGYQGIGDATYRQEAQRQRQAQQNHFNQQQTQYPLTPQQSYYAHTDLVEENSEATTPSITITNTGTSSDGYIFDGVDNQIRMANEHVYGYDPSLLNDVKLKEKEPEGEFMGNMI